MRAVHPPYNNYEQGQIRHANKNKNMKMIDLE